MNPASKDIADILLANPEFGLSYTVGQTPGNLYYARMPDSPSLVVATFDNPGGGPTLTFEKSTSNYFFSSISVRVRDNAYEAGWSRMFDIVTYLHGLSDIVTPDGLTVYTLIKAMNDPQVLFWDKNDRVIFFTNFDCQRKPISIN